MKRTIGTVALFAFLAAAAFVPLASAQCVTGTGTNILLKWDFNGFSYEGPAPYTNYTSPAGNVLTNVIGASLLCGPLGALNPLDPLKEYTMVWSGLVSSGTVTVPIGTGFKKTTVYTGGSFALYEGPVNARSYTNLTVPAPALALPNYTDGVVLLSGAIDSLTTLIVKSPLGTINGSFRGKYRVLAGPYATAFCNGHMGAGLLDGLWNPVNPPAGYTSQNNGKLDGIDCTTVVVPSTWGRLKAIYR